MPIRIYALAKELKVDSKELVDICNKAGITGKGSALASLDDDEVDRVKAYLRGPTKKPAEEPAAPVEVAPAAPEPPSKEPEPSGFSREDYVGLRSTGKIRVLGKGKAKKEDEAPAEEEQARDEADDVKKPKKREPVINVNMAPLPEPKQAPVPPTPSKERAQKPEIRLPKDAIAGRKRGAPLQHLTRLEKKAQKPDGSWNTPAATSEAAGPPSSPPLGKTRQRRSKAGAAAGTPEEGKGKAERGLAGMASARQKRRRSRGRLDRDDERSYKPRTLTRKGTNTAAPRKGAASLELPCTVRSFSEAAGVSASQVQRTLMGMGAMLTINAQIDNDMVELLAAELGVELEIKQPQSLEESLLSELDTEDSPEDLEPRAPVVTFLGHVDHGKTSLLDYLIGSDVVSGEAGGITQHIRAYQIQKDGRPISFVDTPGHEAFTEMRARGANVTDIAVLVIAADDGIMPQTEEAISHARAAEVPIVVALNKMDLPGADPNRVMTQMTEHELVPSEWGGDIEVVPTSAISGDGMDDLLETLLGIADLHEYKAASDRPAQGVCLESQQEADRGVVAKVVVQKGTLRVGDVVLCGGSFGRVKAMYDTLRTDEPVEEAGPSVPVNVIGFDSPPEAGEQLFVLEDIGKARELAAQRSDRSRQQSLSGNTIRISFDEFQRRLEAGELGSDQEIVTLRLIIRADTRGSIEAIEKELQKIEHPEIEIKILHKSVGAVTAADVHLAHASEAVIVAFSVIPDDAARSLADEYDVEIRRYDVIYKVTDDVKALLEGQLKPEKRIVELGHAVVKQVFSISRVGTVAGCYVVRGSIERDCRIRVNRDGRTIGDYPIDSLKHIKDDVKEVPRGMECGIKLSGFNDIKQDDVLEAYRTEEVARTL